MNNIWQLVLTLILAFWVGFQLGHLVTSFRYETDDRYGQRRKSDNEIDKIESVE